MTAPGYSSLMGTVTSCPNESEELMTTRKPRICMPSWRNFRKFSYQGGLYEAQDVFCDVDDVDLICPEPRKGFHVIEGMQKWLMWRDVSRSLANVNPGLQPVRLQKDYDLFIAVCQSWWDLFFINAIKGWREHCKVSVCLIDELWAASIPRYKYWLHVFKKFDHIFLGFQESVPALEQAIGRPCHWLPGAVDTIRFGPYPTFPDRVVDVYSMGRRWEGIHRSMLEAATQNGIFYIYDTFPGSTARPSDHRQHRDLIANIAKRSRMFVVGPAKLGIDTETRGQIEIGYRFFEGAAAGAVMIGKAPQCSSFRELFDWPDAVLDLQSDGSNVAALLSSFRNEPERFSEIGRRNARESLLRHDWAYRWRQILQVAGLKSVPALEKRERKLKNLSELSGCET